MTTDVLEVGPDIQTRRLPVIGVLSRKEAGRILTSPAVFVPLGLIALVLGIDFSAEGAESDLIPRSRAALAQLVAELSLLFFGPITFVATHVVASSSRRSGADRQSAAAPVDQRRRDLALCLAVLLGPATVSLALASLGAWLAVDGTYTPRAGSLGPWAWTDVAQVPAIVLGAGVLGVVAARWLPYPGSLFVCFGVLIFGTGWLGADPGGDGLRAWLAPYVVMDLWLFDEPWPVLGSRAWHVTYLFALSGLGVCAVALRQPERRTRWLIAGSVALFAVITAGLLQLPPMQS